MENLNYADIFATFQPGFFEKEHIRSLSPEEIYDEQVMNLHTFSVDAVSISCPSHITFGLYQGDFEVLKDAIREVEDDWVQFFSPKDQVFCAFDGDKIVSFCMLDDFGSYQGLKIGAPGCVGTIPAYRKQGIGLKMVQKATQLLKEAGYDLGWIHYTHVEHWYAKLGYETVLKWNCNGFVHP